MTNRPLQAGFAGGRARAVGPYTGPLSRPGRGT
jgi:hypothetical protein